MSVFLRCPAIQPTLWSLRDDFTDATVSCDNNTTTFQVHKIILASSSNFFRTKFLTSNVVELPNVGRNDMENLIAFIYKGGVTLAQNEETHSFVELVKNLGIELALEADETETEPLAKKLKSSLEINICDSPPETNINNLPPEVIIRILSYVPTYDLLQNVARVSNLFYECSKNPRAHKDVKFDMRIDQHFAQLFLRDAKFIRSFTVCKTKFRMLDLEGKTFAHLKKNPGCCDTMLLALREHERLESIDVEDGNMFATYDCIGKLATTKWWAKLRTLKLRAVKGLLSDHPHFEAGLVALHNSKYLQYFSLSSYDPTPHEMQIAYTCPNLKNIYGFPRSECEDYIQMMTSVNHSMEELTMRLDKKDVSNEIYSHLERCQNLKTFLLFAAKFRRFDIFTHLKNLTNLEILCPTLPDLLESNLPHSLSQVKNLRILHGNPMFATAFAAACSNLLTVELVVHRQIEAVGGVVAPFFQMCPHLEVLLVYIQRRSSTVNFDSILYNVWNHVPKIKFFALRVEAGIESGLRKSTAKEILQKCASLKGILTNSLLYLRKETSLGEVSDILTDHGYYDREFYCGKIVTI